MFPLIEATDRIKVLQLRLLLNFRPTVYIARPPHVDSLSERNQILKAQNITKIVESVKKYEKKG